MNSTKTKKRAKDPSCKNSKSKNSHSTPLLDAVSEECGTCVLQYQLQMGDLVLVRIFVRGTIDLTCVVHHDDRPGGQIRTKNKSFFSISSVSMFITMTEHTTQHTPNLPN